MLSVRLYTHANYLEIILLFCDKKFTIEHVISAVQSGKFVLRNQDIGRTMLMCVFILSIIFRKSRVDNFQTCLSGVQLP